MGNESTESDKEHTSDLYNISSNSRLNESKTIDNQTPNVCQLVLYPFCSTVNEINLFRIGKGFEIKFSKNLFSKKVNSRVKDISRNYFEIEIDENTSEGHINSVFSCLHEFTEPADFYLEMENKAYYEDIYKKLIDDDLNQVVGLSSKIDLLGKSGFPEFFQPVLSTAGHYENYKNLVKYKDHEQISTVGVKDFFAIPVGPKEGSLEIAMKFLTSDNFEEQNLFYTKIFSLFPIIRFKNIKKYYEESNLVNNNRISIHLLKRCIQLHAYYCLQGPFRKCWIKFGYDPVLDFNNYKYQIFESRIKKVNFQIFERPEIIYEVEKNMDWYVCKEFDSKEGFVSLALKNFIIYVLGDQRVVDIDEEIEDLSSSEMLLFN